MRYYVNKNAQSNWDHEVHKNGCSRLNLVAVENKQYLWDFNSCWPAKQEAKRYYKTADWCKHCCPNCHTS